MTILVSLFTWIYIRDRQRRFALWVWGWAAILVHFAALLLLEFKLLSGLLAGWIAVMTLEICGSCFFLSVSRACSTRAKRLMFLGLVTLPAFLYTTLLFRDTSVKALYPCLLAVIVATGVGMTLTHYNY